MSPADSRDWVRLGGHTPEFEARRSGQPSSLCTLALHRVFRGQQQNRAVVVMAVVAVVVLVVVAAAAVTVVVALALAVAVSVAVAVVV